MEPRGRKYIHRGIRAPRPHHIGEQVFFEHWTRYVDVEPEEDRNGPGRISRLEDILSELPGKLDQRMVTVAATFMTWMGNNNGFSLWWEAERLRKDGVHYPVVHAWTDNNRRIHGVNSGFRTIEAMLAPDDHFGPRQGFAGWGLMYVPQLRWEDFETIEHLCEWLGEGNGRQLVIQAHAEIQRRQDAEYRERAEEEHRVA